MATGRECLPTSAPRWPASCERRTASVLFPGTLDNINDPLCTHLVFGAAGPVLSGINNASVNIAGRTVSGLDLLASICFT